MERVDALLAAARARLIAGRGMSWAVRGLAVAALAALAVEVGIRVRPIDPATPELLGCLALGLVVAAGGWVRAWPGRAEVARLVDNRLGARERFSTALQFAAADGVLILRQRADASDWAATADLDAVREGGLPLRSAAVAVAAGLAALVLALAPNPALQGLRAQRADQAAQDRAAVAVGQLVQQAEKGQPGESPTQKQALVQQLKNAQQAVRTAPDPQSAVAALSQAQSAVSALQDPNTAAKSQAAAAAGQALQANPAAAKAGQALAAGDSQAAASQLNQLAAGVSQLNPSEQQQLASSLSQAASQSASGNPQLSQALQQASSALQKGDDAAAQQALQQAAQAEQDQSASEQFNGDASQAVNGLQQAKSQLAKQAQGQTPAGQGQQPGPGTQPGQGQPGQGAGAGAGQGSGQGTGSGTGSGNGGSGSGSGSGSGNGGSGSGTGSGSGSGANSGKGAAATEKVYVPGQSTANGTPQGNTNDPSSGQATQLVPYTDVLAEYSAAAQSEVDREVIPQSEQDLVRQYFQDLGQ
jgi:chemotaxis protein histidine kinase CheA